MRLAATCLNLGPIVTRWDYNFFHTKRASYWLAPHSSMDSIFQVLLCMTASIFGRSALGPRKMSICTAATPKFWRYFSTKENSRGYTKIHAIALAAKAHSSHVPETICRFFAERYRLISRETSMAWRQISGLSRRIKASRIPLPLPIDMVKAGPAGRLWASFATSVEDSAAQQSACRTGTFDSRGNSFFIVIYNCMQTA